MMFVGTPLGTSDHCFVSCALRAEHLYWSTISEVFVFLKHRTDWDNVHCAVRSCTWSTILKSAYPLDVFDLSIGEVIGRLVPTTSLRNRSGDKQWFDANCRRDYDAKQPAYQAWCRARSADH